MKKATFINLLLSLSLCIASFSACGTAPSKQNSQSYLRAQGSAQQISTEPYNIQKNGLTCTVDPIAGSITRIESNEQSLELDGVLVDVGYKKEYLLNQLGYLDFSKMSTWELPKLVVRKQPLPSYTVQAIEETQSGVNITHSYTELIVKYLYEFLPDGLRVSAEISTKNDTTDIINGVGFIVNGMQMDFSSLTYEFPGNTPAGVMNFDGLMNYRPVQTDYCNAVTVFKDDIASVNIVFLNEQEKWSSGVYYNEKNNVCTVSLSAVESYVSAEESVKVGTLFIQLTGSAHPYEAAQEYYASCGYKNPENSVNDGPVYSAHPYGTMDTDFTHPRTLQQYANELDSLDKMGIKNVWLLPVFLHPINQVYEAIDQNIIDPRYGGDEGVLAFTSEAHSRDMRVLFDYVPHGPRPEEALAQNNPAWCSVKKNGSLQIEWECVSFDYNNPEYLAYTTDVVRRHAQDLGVDGARIDCSMGGLSNWAPQDGLRPSSSGINAGVSIVKAIKQGFIDGGVTPMLLPENFHPIPIYAAYTDIFYDMPFYRVLYDLNNRLSSNSISETEYVELLQHWLDAERRTSVKGQVKLRFLGNHDTSDWTFDAARPQEVYGEERYRAMMALISFIDGVPMVYQGDEDPQAYGMTHLRNQEKALTDIFTARKQYISSNSSIKYLPTGCEIFAFTRTDDNSERLILINLSSTPQTYITDNPLAFSKGVTQAGNTLTLAAYAYAILE